MVTTAPALAGLFIAAAEPGGNLRESVALSRAYAEARTREPGELLRDVLSTAPSVDPATRPKTPEDIQRVALDQLRRAVRILDRDAQRRRAGGVQAVRVRLGRERRRRPQGGRLPRHRRHPGQRARAGGPRRDRGRSSTSRSRPTPPEPARRREPAYAAAGAAARSQQQRAGAGRQRRRRRAVGALHLEHERCGVVGQQRAEAVPGQTARAGRQVEVQAQRVDPGRAEVVAPGAKVVVHVEQHDVAE